MSLEIIQAYFTKHRSYQGKRRNITPVGILVHSTGAVNRELRRYVDAPERLGKNLYNNHWNKSTASKSVHGFIGYDKAKKVIVAETLPPDRACWGCGGGKKGSYNYDPHAYLQFELCQGSNTDSAYYWEAIGVAEEYFAHLCRQYGWSAAQITSHKEACAAGYASNHGDPEHWWKAVKSGLTMKSFRRDVKELLNGELTPDRLPTDAPSSLYRVQCGAFTLKKNAEYKLKSLQAAGYEAFVTLVNGLWKVQVGAFRKKENAEALLKKLEKDGFTAIVVKAK